jgi:RNA polymerase sigma-70 factor (ECF subfamily)
MDPTDQELLAATAAEDGEAFAMFWRPHTSTVMAFGIHRCASSEDVADLVADTFLAAFRAAGRYQAQTATAAPWLLGIATRLTSNRQQRLARWRRANRRAAGEPPRFTERPSEAALALGISPDAARLRLARARKLQAPRLRR